jgi:segregation and condensation protein A
VRYRTAPLPMYLRRVAAAPEEASEDPLRLAKAIGGLLRLPPEVSVSHMTIQRVSVGDRLRHLRDLLRRGSFHFDDAVREADRLTVAMTIWALLELYKRGEASWEQPEPFADIVVSSIAGSAHAATAVG